MKPGHAGPARAAYDRVVADYFVVETVRGPCWEEGRPRRRQPGWEAHGEFMDRLVDDGFVVIGGPVDDLDGDEALLVVDAAGEPEVRGRLADDPWMDGVLRIKRIRAWTLWLGAPDGLRARRQ